MEASLLVLFVALFVFAATWMMWRGGRPGGPGAPPGELSSQLAVLGQRLTAIEGRQSELRDGLQSIGTGVTEAGALTTGLREATEGIRSELNRARDSLTGLESATKARRELEDQSARSLRRLEQVIAGTASKGGAGENMVDLVFSRLPVEWQVRDFRVGNRTVEFGLRLPNGLVLPIDSKWPATNLLESFLAATEPAEQARLKAQLESVVTEKAREVRKYLDPDLTTGFALAVLPDAVDELCGALKADCLRLDVVLIGQGMLVPYLLLVFQTVLRSARTVDVEKLASHLDVAERSLAALRDEIEGRLSRAVTMLGNSRDELRLQSSRVGSSLNAIQVHNDLAPAQVEDAAEPLPLFAGR